MNEKRVCKHCGSDLKKLSLPPDSDFNCAYLLVCFNDECGYFKRGWDWMKERYNVTASYRYKYNPFYGDEGPLPVQSPDTFKDLIGEDVKQ